MSKCKVIAWTGVTLWMALIFFLSHQPSTDSSELSSGVVEVILMAAEKIAPELREHVDMVHHIVRKNAHFIIYLVLGVLVMNALKTSGVSRCRALIWAISICFVYAISDEFHQMFIPGRGPALMDVAIDSAGAAVGAGLYVMIAEFKAMKKQSKSWNEVF